MTNVKVVVEPEAKENAYRMGYERFETVPENEEKDPEWFSHYTEWATWSNTIKPKLRAMAGANHTKGGTYTDHTDIVLVQFPDDRPMDGETWNSRDFTSELVDKFRDGAYDKIEGNEYGKHL